MKIGKTKIGNVNCYLIEDFISSDPPAESNIVTEYESASVSCSALEVVRLRNETDYKIYGMWQTLIVSGMLDTLDKNKTYALYTDNNNERGQILYWADGIPQTISLQDASQEAKEKAEAIVINETDLILPAESIYSVSEKDQHNRNIRKQRISQITIIIALGVITYFVSQTYANSQLETMESIKAELLTQKIELEEKQKSLQTSYTKIEYFDDLAPIVFLLRHGFQFSVELILFEEDKYQVIFKQRKIPEEAFEGFQILNQEHQPGGETIVTYH